MRSNCAPPPRRRSRPDAFHPRAAPRENGPRENGRHGHDGAGAGLKGRRGTRAERHHQAVRFAGGQRPHQPVRGPRPGARPARRERRGQDDPDERALRPAAARRGRDPGRRDRPPAAIPEGRDRRRHRHGAPALHARAGVHRCGERDPRHRGNPAPRPARPAQDPQRRPRALPQLRPAGRPGRPGGEPAGRPPAAGRDHQGTRPGSHRADPRRADRRAHPGRDRGPVPDHPAAARRRQVHRLHLAQAQGSPGHRGHDHRAAQGGGRRGTASVGQRG